ncbi:MAG: restriction endonuclease subunit S [Candidatus Parcubacteria bacterium]|nr:restriction endonuclease subunit S [Candidatus Parcubacteria bacterium]
MTWPTRKLGEICDFYNGLWKGKEPPYIEVGVIRNTNFTKDGKLDDSDIAYLDVEKKQFEKRKLEYGDIILEKSGGGPKQPVGRVIIFDKKDGEFSFSNFTSAIRVKNKKELDFNFLHRYLFDSYISGVTERMQSHSTGIRNLDLGVYKEIEIPLPPLPEQHRIVKILDEAFASIERTKVNTEKNLQNSRELFESYLQNIFVKKRKDWNESKLGDIATIEYGFTDKAKNRGDFRYIRITDIDKNGNLIGEGKMYIASSKEAKKFILNDDDLLMARTGATFAKVLLYNDIEKSVFASYLIRISFNEKIINKLYWYFSKSKIYWDQANKLSSGSAQPQFNGAALKEVIFAYPKSITEQKDIVKKLDALAVEVKKLEAIYKQKLDDLEELKKSILKKAFEGEL